MKTKGPRQIPTQFSWVTSEGCCGTWRGWCQLGDNGQGVTGQLGVVNHQGVAGKLGVVNHQGVAGKLGDNDQGVAGDIHQAFLSLVQWSKYMITWSHVYMFMNQAF